MTLASYQQEYYVANRDHLRARQREYQKQTKKERRVVKLAYYAANKEAVLKKNREWTGANREKVREYMSHRRARRTHWLGIYKTKKGCEKCGYNKFAGSLHFDHIDPSAKNENPSWCINHSLKILFAELRKCRILCANCHGEETYVKDDEGNWKHLKFWRSTK